MSLSSDVTLTATGTVPPDVAWERYERPALWTEWAPHLTDVECSTPTIRAGSTGTVTALGLVRAKFIVTSVDPAARTWSWTVRSGPLTMDLTHRVVATRDGATLTGLRLRGPVGIVHAYAPIAQAALHQLVNEQDRPAPGA